MNVADAYLPGGMENKRRYALGGEKFCAWLRKKYFSLSYVNLLLRRRQQLTYYRKSNSPQLNFAAEQAEITIKPSSNKGIFLGS
jgi:hypothetical protein